MADCTKKARLPQEKQEAANAFREILTVLRLEAATASDEEFLLVQSAALEREAKSGQAFMALEKHMGEHGC